MAANQQGRRVYSFNTALQVQNILPDIVLVDGNLEEAGYLAWLNQHNMVLTPTKQFDFYVDDWLPATDTVDGAVTGTTATTIKVDTPLAYIANQLWMNKRTGEVMYILSVSTTASTIQVERAVGRNSTDSTGTAAAAINDEDTLIRLGASHGEVTKRQVAHSTTPAQVFNFAEKMRAEVQMSDWQRKVKNLTGNDWPYQLDKTFKQFRKDLNGKLYIGERNSLTINGQSHFLTGGIDFFISTNILAASGTLHEYQFDQWLVDEAMRFGPAEKIMLCSSNVIRAITEMSKDQIEIRRVNLGSKDVAMGIQVLRYVSPTGKTLTLMEDRFLSESLQGHARVIDMQVCRIRHFSGDGLDGRPRLIPNTQDVDSDDHVATIIADIGLEVGPEKHHGKLSGVTAGAAGRSVS